MRRSQGAAKDSRVALHNRLNLLESALLKGRNQPFTALNGRFVPPPQVEG
jgi:hypothetical protein